MCGDTLCQFANVRLETDLSLYNRKADTPGQFLGVVNELAPFSTIPDIEIDDPRGPLIMVPGTADLAHLNPLLPQDLEPL